MHELFFNLIHDKVEEEVKKDNKELGKISLESEDKKNDSKRPSIMKRASVIDINMNDLDIQQIQTQSINIIQILKDYLLIYKLLYIVFLLNFKHFIETRWRSSKCSFKKSIKN